MYTGGYRRIYNEHLEHTEMIFGDRGNNLVWPAGAEGVPCGVGKGDHSDMSKVCYLRRTKMTDRLI